MYSNCLKNFTWRSLDIASEEINSFLANLRTKHIVWMSVWPRSSSGRITARNICTSYKQTNKQHDMSWAPLSSFLSKATQVQGVALTGRNITGPPSHAAPWWVMMHMHCCRVLQNTDDDNDRWQWAKQYWPPYIHCVGGTSATADVAKWLILTSS